MSNAFFRFAYCLLWPFLRIVFPVEVRGLENLPRHGALLCPNHASDWDPLLLCCALPIDYRLHIMAKKQLFDNPVLRWIITRLGAFPVDRDHTDIQSVKTAMQAIRSGDNLLIFPEGTTIRNGIGYHDSLPAHAKAGVAMIGIRTGAALVPVFLDGPKRVFHKSRIIFGAPITPVYTGRHGTAEEMQRIADEILKTAYALGGQEVGGKPLCRE